MGKIGPVDSEEVSFESVDRRRRDRRRRITTYPTSSPGAFDSGEIKTNPINKLDSLISISLFTDYKEPKCGSEAFFFFFSYALQSIFIFKADYGAIPDFSQ